MKRTLLTPILVVAIISRPAPAAPPLFLARTDCPGLTYRNVSGDDAQLAILEQNGQGLALLDFDRDGWIDLFVTNGGRLDEWRRNRHPGCRLYRNLGNWRFVDVTANTGVAGQAWGTGVAAADYDDDGDIDLYVMNWGPNVLYRNNGDGTFTDVTDPAGVGDPAWSSSAVFADFNGDGLLDLYVSNYVRFDPDDVPGAEADGSPCTYRGIPTGCGPWRYTGQRDTLYLQRSDHTFADASAGWGLKCTAGFRGMGLVAADFDNDGDLDLYVGCDVMPNLYLENVDRRGFRSVGDIRGGAVNASGKHESGMGIAAADLFNRGWIDLLTTNFAGETNTFYHNQRGHFNDQTLAVGLAGHRAQLGWGIVVADFNQDGHRDVVVCNGHIYPQVDQLNDANDRYRQPPRVYLGTPQGRFRELPTAEAFASSPRFALNLRACVAGDLDNDGDLDVVAVQHNGPLVVFENRSNKPAAHITLRTRRGGLSPFNARVTIGRRQVLYCPNQGYQSSHDPRLIVHGASGQTATVRWPDGTRETFRLPQGTKAAVWQAGKGLQRSNGGIRLSEP